MLIDISDKLFFVKMCYHQLCLILFNDTTVFGIHTNLIPPCM